MSDATSVRMHPGCIMQLISRRCAWVLPAIGRTVKGAFPGKKNVAEPITSSNLAISRPFFWGGAHLAISNFRRLVSRDHFFYHGMQLCFNATTPPIVASFRLFLHPSTSRVDAHNKRGTEHYNFRRTGRSIKSFLA